MTLDSEHLTENRSTGLLKSPIAVVGILVATSLFFVQALSLWFTQDDAYISYRYAQNALNGHGLVFNPGERVEGYTNFLWVIYLILAGSVGIGFDIAAKCLGIASGIGMIIVTALIVRQLRLTSSQFDNVYAACAAIWVGMNGALAYWAVSGLETALFGFLVSLSVLLWLRHSQAVVVPISLAILTRPEGGLIWIFLGVAEWFRSRDMRATAWHFAAVAIILIPFAAFKLLYYGDLLPNPFHAKTGFSTEYFVSGIRYLWEFLRDYGLWGALLLLIAASIRNHNAHVRSLAVLVLTFTVYIISVGGDVLRPHRFFVPLLPSIAVAGIVGLSALMANRRGTVLSWSIAGFVLLWAMAGWLTTRQSLEETRRLEMALTEKMSKVAHNLRGFEDGPFSVAASTIGRLGYDLPDCRIIDMLGLTDREIARNPETIPGIESSWRERNFNASYVLKQQPEYILFSTGYKPSAPAERALLLYPQFRRGYFGFVSYDGDRPLPAYRRKLTGSSDDPVWPDTRFADAVNEAFNVRATQDHPRIAKKFIEAHHSGPGDFGLLLAFAANAYLQSGDVRSAIAYADSAIAIDSFTIEAWRVKSTAAESLGDTASVRASRFQLATILSSAR